MLCKTAIFFVRIRYEIREERWATIKVLRVRKFSLCSQGFIAIHHGYKIIKVGSDCECRVSCHQVYAFRDVYVVLTSEVVTRRSHCDT